MFLSSLLKEEINILSTLCLEKSFSSWLKAYSMWKCSVFIHEAPFRPSQKSFSTFCSTETVWAEGWDTFVLLFASLELPTSFLESHFCFQGKWWDRKGAAAEAGEHFSGKWAAHVGCPPAPLLTRLFYQGISFEECELVNVKY